jgi:acyl-CoA thioesterase FadM
MWFWLVLFFFVLYFLIDVHYFVRVILTYIFAVYIRKKIGLLDSSEIYGICLPSDADFLFVHMNNARYLREHDFGRFDQGWRSGIMLEAMKRGGIAPAAAITIRYRLPLMMFSAYKLVSTPIWWDSKFFYYEQKIVTLRDGIVRSIAYTKLAMVKCDVDAIIKELFPNVKKPEIPEDLKKWIEFNELSSEKMKTK